MPAMNDTPRLPHVLKRLYLLQSGTIEKTLRCHGLARSQWLAMKHVHRNGTMTQRELQDLLKVEPATLSGIVDGLVAKGWLERLEHPDDRRCKALHLTPEGEARWHDIPDVVDLVESRMTEGIAERDLKTLQRILEKMTANLERKEA
jgi:MarR family transcriptional regulator for hemolysin